MYQCTNVPMYRCTNVPMYQSADVPMCRCANVPMCQCANLPMYQCADVPMCRCANVPMCRCANVLIYQCTDVPMYQCTNVPMCRCANVPMYRCTDVPMYRCANVPMCQWLVWKSWRKDFWDVLALALQGSMSETENPVVELEIETIRFRNRAVSAGILDTQTKNCKTRTPKTKQPKACRADISIAQGVSSGLWASRKLPEAQDEDFEWACSCLRNGNGWFGFTPPSPVPDHNLLFLRRVMQLFEETDLNF
jgi:hypothetical protein